MCLQFRTLFNACGALGFEGPLHVAYGTVNALPGELVFLENVGFAGKGIFQNIKIGCFGDFPVDPGVKNPLYNAGDAGSVPVWGTLILHVVEQLKPMCHNSRVSVL